jgi:hypothetical protein
MIFRYLQWLFLIHECCCAALFREGCSLSGKYILAVYNGPVQIFGRVKRIPLCAHVYTLCCIFFHLREYLTKLRAECWNSVREIDKSEHLLSRASFIFLARRITASGSRHSVNSWQLSRGLKVYRCTPSPPYRASKVWIYFSFVLSAQEKTYTISLFIIPLVPMNII